jgi:hypothetical protein
MSDLGISRIYFIIFFLLLAITQLALSQEKKKPASVLPLERGLDDFTIWQQKGNIPILAGIHFQSSELFFFSPIEQGFVEKVSAIYFSEPELKKEVLRRTEDAIHFPYGQNSFSSDYADDSFGASWTGIIKPAYSETYKLITQTDDGVRLWINGKLIIDKWQDMGVTEFSSEVPMIAGKDYNIKMEYYDRGGDAYAALSWQSQSTKRSVIRRIGSFDFGFKFENPYGLESDWEAVYFKGREFKDQITAKKEAAINFTSASLPFAPSVPQENFCARFQSKIKVPKSGTYTFITTSDDGIRLKINGRLIIDQWTWMGPTEFSEKVDLKEGDLVAIEVEYFQGGGGKFLKLEWEGSYLPRQLLVKKGQTRLSFDNIKLDVYPGKIYSQDLSGDGQEDLIILHPSYNGKISILYQEQANLLSSPISLRAGKDPKEIHFADINKDGKKDMIILGKSSASNSVAIQKNKDWFLEPATKWGEAINAIIKANPVGVDTTQCVKLSSKKNVCYDKELQSLITYD